MGRMAILLGWVCAVGCGARTLPAAPDAAVAADAGDGDGGRRRVDAGRRDAGARRDAGPCETEGATPGAVQCGDDVCVLGDRLCCHGVSPAGEATLACVSRRAECAGQPVRCDGPEDCDAGEVCCVHLRADEGPRASCVPADACPGGGSDRVLCHSECDCVEVGGFCGTCAGSLPGVNATCTLEIC